MDSTDGALAADHAPGLGGVAHDLNNLLMVIAEHARIALEEPDLASLEEILGAAERGSELTSRLLASARAEPPATGSLDLNAALAGVERLLARAVGDRVTVQIAPTPGLAPVSCEQGQLERILLNLALNSRDAMPGGGEVTVETASAGACARLTVTDDGAGMDAEVAARAFEPFFTTKPRGRGTGLGLATVVDVVGGFGGRVYLHSEPGRGTTVNVYIPFADTALAA